MKMDRLYNHINLHAIDVIEDPTDIGASVREDILEQGEDTLTFLGNYIDQIDVKIDKQKLKAFAKELYMEAGEWFYLKDFHIKTFYLVVINQ